MSMSSGKASKVTDAEVLEAMEKWGGHFAERLARAGQVADNINLNRIKQGWPEYWRKYSEYAEQDKFSKIA